VQIRTAAEAWNRLTVEEAYEKTYKNNL